MLDSTSLKPFQQTLALKNQAPPPLSKLKNLSFVGIEELDDNRDHVIPWEALTSLRSLKLYHLPNLTRLPEGIQHLTSLQELSIWRCKMKVLPKWIDNLKSLEKLAIWVCPKFKSLPQGISGLTSLKTLDIEECPILLQRCQKATGADWDKIAHIPNKPSGVKIQPDDSEDESASSEAVQVQITCNHHSDSKWNSYFNRRVGRQQFIILFLKSSLQTGLHLIFRKCCVILWF